VYKSANAPNLEPETPNAVKEKQIRNTRNKRTSLPPALFMSTKTRSNVKKALSNGGGPFFLLICFTPDKLPAIFHKVPDRRQRKAKTDIDRIRLDAVHRVIRGESPERSSQNMASLAAASTIG
jgi:hypothetical protein